MATTKKTTTKNSEAAQATAVISTGGKQYVVTNGTWLRVEKLETEVGTKLTFEPLMLTDEKGALVTGGQVTAEVVDHGKGTKLRVFTYKSKKRQRRTIGHRQQYTTLKVTAIGGAKAAKAAKVESAD